jgi:hypothetical protein
MRDFKFFQKGTVDMVDGDVRSTASFNDDTPEGHMNRRALYHTDRNLYDRLRFSDNELEQFHLDRQILEMSRRINEQRDLNDNPIRLFQTTSTVTINPTLWTKVKMFGTGVKLVLKSTWVSDPFGVTYVSIVATLVTIIGISKILNIW